MTASSSTPTPTPSVAPDRAAIVAVARRWIGTPYRHRASLEGVGCDCIGLVRGVWREFWGDEPEPLPAYTPDWAESGGVESLLAVGRRHLVPVAVAAAHEGDVVLFRWRPDVPAKHVGILVAADRFVHAYDGAAVVESPLGPWWRRRLAAAFAFPGLAEPTGAPASE